MILSNRLFVKGFFLGVSAVFACPPVVADNVANFNAQDFAPVQEPVPRSERINKEDQLSLPEGGKAIKGMDISLRLETVDVYGLNVYSLQDMQQIVSSAMAFHDGQHGAPKITAKPRVVDKGNGHYQIVVQADAYLSLAYAIAQEITRKYQDGKYFLSRAVVPSQDIDQKHGRIEICAVEGYLASDPSVEVKDAGGDKLASLKESLLLRLKPLVGKKALNFQEFERQLLLIRDMPGVDLQTTFKQVPTDKTEQVATGVDKCQQAAANGAGATNLAVALGVDLFDGVVSADNYGTDSAGPWFVRFNFGANSRFLPGDRYTFDASVSADGKELKNYGLAAQVPLGNDGWKLNASHRGGDAQPGAEFEDLAVKNKTNVSEVGVEYPFIRSRRANGTFSGKLKNLDVDTDLLGVSFIRDRVRTAQAKVSYDFADKYNGLNLFELEVTQGMDTNGATAKGSVLSSRPEASPNFTKYTGTAKTYRGVGDGLTWVGSLKAQYADKPLYASEEFELGGRSNGRGADIGILTGDKGVAVTTQLEYDQNHAAGTAKYYGFVDHGYVWQVDQNVKGTVDEKGRLTTTGVGVNFESKDNWYINAEVAQPISASQGIEKKTNAYLGVGYKF